ncbi:MAG: hypothetical protein S4CHLAM102_12600 [Chlamydiia bacterium]|nr:hypothetical protein [Chlamydiia bacterium]
MEYAMPLLAAGLAVILPFKQLMEKSNMQLGAKTVKVTWREGITQGCKTLPTVGGLIGAQMIFQHIVKGRMGQMGWQEGMHTDLASSAVVGLCSSPFVAVFNGGTMGWTITQSLKRFTPPIAGAIVGQETAFVGGIACADRISEIMKGALGDNKGVEYTAYYISGFAGSYVGHPFNTLLTRWQANMALESMPQLMAGSLKKGNAVGIFTILYKGIQAVANTIAKETTQPSGS